MSAFDELGKIRPVQIWDGVVGRVVAGERASIVAMDLDPGIVVPVHSHDNEQTGMLLAGSVSFTIGDETRELRPGGTWAIPSNVPHTVTVGPEGATLVELFAPVRADWESLPRLEPSPPRGFGS